MFAKGWSWLWRIPLYSVVVLCALLLVFRWLPVPTSAFMLTQDVTAIFSKEVPFVRHDWVSLDEIPRHVQIAVIASEDQRFAEHWGMMWTRHAQPLRMKCAGVVKAVAVRLLSN